MKTSTRIVWLFVCLMTFSSCSLKRKAAVFSNEKSPVAEIIEHQRLIHDLDTKVNINIDQLNFKLGGQIKMTADSCLWASAQAFLGIEAGRAMLTQERLQVVNRLQKNFIDFPMVEIGQEATYQALSALTSILLNKLFVPFENNVSSKAFRMENKNGLNQFESFAHGIRSTFTLDQDKHLTESSFELPSYNWTMTVSYSDFRPVEIDGTKIDFPYHMDFMIHLTATNYYHGSIDLNKPVFNGRPAYPFEIPSSYKKATISDLVMMKF